ncbi:hypothetical protein [Lichenicola sp.]|uniref:hypothetical protein n=1 Tax=Lichenicola sp. TaxID=2804529 RepID=UPI003AFF926D
MSEFTTARALIGHTGFVGSNLVRQQQFDALYNSTSIGEIDSRHFTDVVCAGVGAVKWWANQNPDEDRARIEGLMAHLDTISADNFTLISTIDVYGSPIGVTEADEPVLEGLHAYGANRAMLESWVSERFPNHQIVRLPALFGAGLKKNAIYDLMHDNRIQVINGASVFQWYPLERLGEDLDLVRERHLGVVNLATEPLSMEEIRARFFPGSHIGAEAAPTARYDMRTIHDAEFGGADGYILDRDGVLDAMERFIASESVRGGEA